MKDDKMAKTAKIKVEAPTLPLDAAQASPARPPARRRQSRELAPVAPAAPPAPLSEGMAMIQMIERAARDPSVDLDKMERLIAMRERATNSIKEEVFNTAMARAQEAMQPVRNDSDNSQTHSKYASYGALDRALRPIYTKHGFALTFNTDEGAPDGCVRVVCHVSCQGFTRRYSIDMPADGKGAKGGDVMTKTHATGSAVTYGQRYLLKMIFNIATTNDDDGNKAGDIPQATLSEEQVTALIDQCEAVGCPRKDFLKWAKADKFENIPATYFASCVEALKTYGGKK